MPRAILLLSALVFAALGLSFTFMTRFMAEIVEIRLDTDLARTDFAATYGGFVLGFAGFLATCSTRPEWVRPGLVASGCALAGFASVRLIGILMSTELSPLMLAVLIAEVVGSVASFWAAGKTAVPSPGPSVRT